jgi:hypothetical protein
MPNPFIPTKDGNPTDDSFSFEGSIREIVVGAGTSQLNVVDLYSFWKQWTLEGNAQYLPAFRAVGGDDLGGGNKVAFYAFLQNNWRIRLPAGLDNLLVSGGILATEELDNPFRFDGVLVTLLQPISIQFVNNPDVTQLKERMTAIEDQQSDTIIPNQVSIAATADKTYEKLVSVGNTVDSIFTNTVGINDIVVDTNSRVVSIGATTLDIKKNTNLIPALL